ncbi:remodeling and spacing factor 1 isoform X2 [Lethenteron reissneri]|uniref:remodeling and spacing factor 1 isoform X2 n=1 Tax=Lethenteron reissneri TaxID=7753 RepID=UPI002AB605EC|nr:remodeling and spacing factor 1 isoform X2 [Lethenteron reissneri]
MASVAFSPNFAVVCSFLERYAALLRLPDFNFAELEAALDDTDEAPNALVELHLRLLKTMGQKVARDRWEKHLAKMCEDFDSPLAWELKNLGYPKMSQANKLILLKFLCETQFDDNVRFKATVNEEEAELMRVQPLGRDRHGLVYWIHTDGHFNTRLYTEEQDDLEQSSWKLLSRNREGLAEVLQGLKLAVSGGAGGQEQNSPSCSSSDTEEPTKLPPPYTTAFKLGQKMKENKAETGDSDGKKLEEEGEEEEEEVAPAKKERSEVGEKKGGGASGSPEEAEDEEDSSLMKEAVIKLERLDDTMLEKLSQDTCKEETQAKLPVKKRELRMPTEISPDARPSKSDVDGEAQASGADAGGEGKGVASEGGGAQGTTEGEVENGQNGELGRNGGGSGGGGSGGDVSKGGSVAHKSDAEKDGEDTAAAAPTTRKRGTSATHADRVKDTEKGDSEAVAGNPSKVNGQGSPRRITRQRKAASEEAKKAEEKSSSEEKGSSGESEGDDDGSEESQEEPSEGANIDDSCKRCGLSSHPELILLCDGCDDGYHTACLRPPLMLIPDGDWFCPSCQHKKLCEKMEEELNHLDRMVKKSNRAQRRKEMLTYVGISSENILPRKSVQDDEDEEPVGRQRLERRSSRARKAVSYEYKEFDDAIITAIEEDIKEVKEAKRRMAMEQEAEDSGKEEEEDEEEEEGSTGGASAAAAGGAAPASGPVHRGKDISTILRASGRHSGESDDGATAAAAKPKKRAAGKSSDDDKDEDSDEVDGRRGVVRGARGRKRAPAKRKARRLTALDSFDEESEDEDYQESGTEVEEPDNWVDEFGSGDASSGSDYWQSLSRRPRKPRTEPTRRSQRLRGRPMEEDSDLESSDSEVARAARRAGRNKRSERRTTPARRGTRGNRAIARRKGGRNDSDASESDASHKSSPVAARRAKATATPRKRQTRSSESHESASSASERPVRKRRRAAPAARARSSDEEEEEDEEKAGQRAKPAGSRQRRASGAGGSAQRRQKRPSSARAPVRTPKRKRAARSGRTTTGGAGSSSEEHKEGSGGGGGSGESGEDADEAAIAAGKAQRARDARPRRPRRAAAARGTKAAAAAAAAAAACVSSGEGEGAPPPPARASRRAGATKEGGGGGDDDEDVADDLLGVEDLVDYVTGE